MKDEKTVLAIDLGAESGRVMAAHFDGESLSLEEIHRFANTPVRVRETLYWDVLHLWREIQAGIRKAKHLKPASLAVDAWGVDFALLDKDGRLLGNPVHYRDKRTDGMLEKTFARVSKADIFAQTGVQFLSINTLYQMMSLVETQSPLLKVAETFLTIPDLINFWLTGEKVCEFTNATTTQMYNPTAGGWEIDLMDALGIPRRIFPPIVSPGTRLGEFEGIPVIAPACHDTGSAVAAVPTSSPNFAYISSGTWSLVGLEIEDPIISSEALAANATNEGGVNNTFRFLKNVMGLWILQQCRETWQNQGDEFSYAELTRLAQAAETTNAIVPVDDAMFLAPGDHPKFIQNFCRKTNQPVPETVGEITRCVLESLAAAYRDALEKLLKASGKKADVIHVIGGGSQNELLNELTAKATGLSVVAGPVEATALGNALAQLIALGEIKNFEEGRSMVSKTAESKQLEFST